MLIPSETKLLWLDLQRIREGLGRLVFVLPECFEEFLKSVFCGVFDISTLTDIFIVNIIVNKGFYIMV